MKQYSDDKVPRQHAMKTYGGVEQRLHLLLTPVKEPQMACWVGHRASAIVKTKILSLFTGSHSTSATASKSLVNRLVSNGSNFSCDVSKSTLEVTATNTQFANRKCLDPKL
jgi:hypothetical protein